MTAYQYGLFIHAQAEMVRVEAMKVANEQSRCEGGCPTYSQDHFDSAAHELENLAELLKQT